MLVPKVTCTAINKIAKKIGEAIPKPNVANALRKRNCRRHSKLTQKYYTPFYQS